MPGHVLEPCTVNWSDVIVFSRQTSLGGDATDCDRVSADVISVLSSGRLVASRISYRLNCRRYGVSVLNGILVLGSFRRLLAP